MPTRTNARKPTRRTPLVDETPDVPIVLTDDGEDEFAEREPLFSLGGTTYTIPVRVSGADALRYATIWMNQGVTAALVWALRECVGDEAYAALIAHKALTQDQLGQLFDAVRAKFDGSAGPKGPRAA
jgi:hypothetical protein